MARVPVLEDLGDVAGKRVLVRTDFNVPMNGPDEAREISDDFRIRAALPTIEWLTSRGATVICASHLGRPKGSPEAKYSMEPVRRRLAELAPGVELLENLRFNAGEEGNSPEFVASLVKGIDMYVNDAFGAAHRSHASIVGPPRTLPSAAGRLLEREVEILGDDHATMLAAIIENHVIRITKITDLRPMCCNDILTGEVVSPARRKIFVDDQLHDASS